MFSFTKNKKALEKEKAAKAEEQKAYRASQPLDKRGRKEGKMLLRGVQKFLRYNDDLITEDRHSKIEEKKDAFAEALRDTNQLRGNMENLAEDLTDTCKKSVKSYRPSAMKENMEVIFVAVVIAMGIRAYFIQQFKIPTGSMQPTMNGIIAYPVSEINPKSTYKAPEGYEKPGLPTRLWDKLWYGRSHVDWVSHEEDALVFDKTHFYDENPFLFFPRTYLITQNGHKYSAPGTISRVASLMNFTLGDFPNGPNWSDLNRLRAKGAVKIKEGQFIAKGFVDTGDQLVVDKFSYHWCKPKRGEVFVFHTRDIYQIQIGIDPELGSQHYIKRLVGTPGDKMEVVPPLLKVNGEVATEFGIKRVMAGKDGYGGYTYGNTPNDPLGKNEYWAMGDNSAHSSDSRRWGVVPQRNIVGRALVVYYPFGHNFGKIK